MSVLESRITIHEDDIINNTENAGSDESENSYRPVEEVGNDVDQNTEETVEIPVYDSSKGEKAKQSDILQQEYIVAYNYGPPQGGQPQSPFGQFPNIGGGGGGGAMGPPLSYDPSRNDFVRLVLIIVLAMLVITGSFLAMVLATPGMKEFFQQSGMMLSFMALGLLLGVNYAISCSPCTRYPPGNFVMLLVTVFAMSIIAAQITSMYKTEIVLYATVATAAVVFVCVLLAFSNFDFTSWMLYVVVIASAFAMVAMVVLMVMLFTGTVMKPLILVILIVGTLIEVVMLTIELQTILGGRTVELSEDDYALGAFMVYTSIISIFIKLVQIFGLLDDS